MSVHVIYYIVKEIKNHQLLLAEISCKFKFAFVVADL